MDKSVIRKIFWNIFSLLLAAFTLWAVFALSGEKSPSEIVEELRDAKAFWVILAVISSLLYVVFEGAAVVTLLSGIGYPVSPLKGLMYSASDAYFSAVTPSATGGQPAAVFFMIKHGIPAGICAVVMLVNLILYTVATVLLGLVAVICEPVLFLNFRLVSKILVAGGLAVLFGLTMLFFAAMTKSHRIFGILRSVTVWLMRKRSEEDVSARLGRIDEARKDFELCSSLMRTKKKEVLSAFLMNIAQRACQIAVPMLLYIGMDGSLRTGLRIFSAQCMVTVGYCCVPVPGAMGVADFLMIDAFTDLIGAEDAFMLEMLGRGVSFYLCTLVSGLVVLAGYITLKVRERRSRQGQ